MKIELFETDETGEHIIAVINGRRMILSTEKTIKYLIDIYGKPIKEFEFSKIELQETTSAFESRHGTVSQTEIERGDFVIFQPKNIEAFLANDNGQLKPGKEYEVLKANKFNGLLEGYDIIDRTDPQPIRTAVGALDVTLSRKTPKVHVERKDLLEMIKSCPTCGDEIVLSCEMDGSFYEGSCEKCEKLIREPRANAATV